MKILRSFSLENDAQINKIKSIVFSLNVMIYNDFHEETFGNRFATLVLLTSSRVINGLMLGDSL